MRPFSELVAIGRILRPQGRRGEVLVEPRSDRPERFPSLRRVWVGPANGEAREMAVVRCWPHKGRFVLKFEGVESITDGEHLRGLELGIGEEQLEALPPGSYYHHELRGLRAEDGQGASLGVVEQVLETGGVAVLVIQGPAGELLVPLAAAFVRQVDCEGRRIVLDPPELEAGTPDAGRVAARTH